MVAVDLSSSSIMPWMLQGREILSFTQSTDEWCFMLKMALVVNYQNTWCVQVLRSPKEAFAAAMQSWRERCEKCVCLQGDYVEKCLHFSGSCGE